MLFCFSNDVRSEGSSLVAGDALIRLSLSASATIMVRRMQRPAMPAWIVSAQSQPQNWNIAPELTIPVNELQEENGMDRDCDHHHTCQNTGNLISLSFEKS